VKIGSNFQHLQIGSLSLSDMHAEVIHPPRVIPVVAAARIGKTLNGEVSDVLEGGDDRIQNSSIHDGVMKR